MENKPIILIGDSPGIYVCGIYLFTANIPVLIIKKDCGLEYECNNVAGLPGVKKEEYNESCYKQAKNMGIEIIDSNTATIDSNTNKMEDNVKDKEEDNVKVGEINGGYSITLNGKSYECKYLVIDKEIPGCLIKEGDNFQVLNNKVKIREAIVVGGVGCEAAFSIKAKVE